VVLEIEHKKILESIPIGIEITIGELKGILNNELYEKKNEVPFGSYFIHKRYLNDLLYLALIQREFCDKDLIIFYTFWNENKADFNGPYRNFGKGYGNYWWAYLRKNDMKSSKVK